MQDQNHFFESEDHTMEFDTQDAQDAKIWSVLLATGGCAQFCLRKISCESGFNLVDFLCNADSCKLAGASSIRNNSDYWWNSFRFGSVGSIGLYHCVDCVWYGAGCTGQGKDVASDWEVSPDWMTGNRVCGSVAS